MKIPPPDLSVTDLREMMVSALAQVGHSDSFIAGFISAQERSGWLRPNCPAWIRNSAGVHFALVHNEGYDDPMFPDANRRFPPAHSSPA